MGTKLSFRRRLRRPLIVVSIAGPVALMPVMASAEGLLDLLFGAFQRPRQASPQGNFFDPFNNNPQPVPPRPVVASSGPAFCVRSCDGRYFPLTRGGASPVQMCQAFCPASPTKVYFGSSIDNAYTASGERYADSENAYAYRKALRADCTCNGRDPAGLAPVDLALDGSLRAGDVIATSEGLVAYSGVRLGNDQTPELTPVASYPGLTSEVRAKLNALKVAPVRADMVANDASNADGTREPPPPVSPPPKAAPDTRAEVN
ncbi:DUF2865 domain-containing protein [Bradyrhizobium sp. ARR65]|uniref:DUF2865 domain-containing protein n=1 Tax=Bradyrhizobium sp. ARR65 TaxID=1040989 RepID=UPI0004658E10|nr:DUF2865 domain-containing protein [Bradyrhizobium sp. ARR65]